MYLCSIVLSPDEAKSKPQDSQEVLELVKDCLLAIQLSQGEIPEYLKGTSHSIPEAASPTTQYVKGCLLAIQHSQGKILEHMKGTSHPIPEAVSPAITYDTDDECMYDGPCEVMTPRVVIKIKDTK